MRRDATALPGIALGWSGCGLAPGSQADDVDAADKLRIRGETESRTGVLGERWSEGVDEIEMCRGSTCEGDRKILDVVRNEGKIPKSFLNAFTDIDDDSVVDSSHEVIGGKRSLLSLLFPLEKRDEILHRGGNEVSGFLRQ